MTYAQFTRRVEDFECEFCGTKINGNGYTNHCTNCLYSKHVDINPGDRLCDCQGLMEPIRLERKNGKEYILHRCKKCGFERRNRVSDKDNRDKIIALSNGECELKVRGY